jgi:ribonuclease BN (tRNA processing enzyme)
VKNALAWGHMTPQMTARLIENAQPKRLICSHFVEISGEEYVAAVQAHLAVPAQVEAAFDGFEIELP